MHVATRCGLTSLTVLIVLGCGDSSDRSKSSSATSKAPPAGTAVSPAEQETAASARPEAPSEVRLVAEEQPSVVLTLQEAADGNITGTLSDGGESMSVVARRGGAGFAGTIGLDGGGMPFTATEQGNRVVLEIGDPGEEEQLAFLPAAGGDHEAAPGVAVVTGK